VYVLRVCRQHYILASAATGRESGSQLLKPVMSVSLL